MYHTERIIPLYIVDVKIIYVIIIKVLSVYKEVTMNPVSFDTTNIGQIRPIQPVDNSKRPVESDVNPIVDDKTSAANSDIVSTSDDGDTLEATKAGINASATTGTLVAASEDGAVTQLDENDEEENLVRTNLLSPQTEERAFQTENTNIQPEDSANNQDQISSLAGYTKQQVEQLYIQGKISRHEYDQNMAARDAREESNSTSDAAKENIASMQANDSRFNSEMNSIAARAADARRTEEIIANGLNNDNLSLISDIYNKL